MLDEHLAVLYKVETKRLNEAVRRNSKRFPKDFMFRLSPKEATCLRSQIATSNARGGRRTIPYAFTELGVAMLSSVLNSDRAVGVNIAIMRTFVRLRQMLAKNEDLARELENLRYKQYEHTQQIQAIFETIQQLIDNPAVESPAPIETKPRIGFPTCSIQTSR